LEKLHENHWDLLNTPLYTVGPIIVPSVLNEICSKVLNLPRRVAYFLKFTWKKKLEEIDNKVKKNIIHYDDITGIEALEGSGHAFISEFDYRDSEIMKTSVNLAGDLAYIL
jgi:hypothetical protein